MTLRPRANTANNRNKKSKRNYGNRVTGPWVFGMVVQKISDIEIRKRECLKKKILVNEQVKLFDDKKIRKEMYKDNRKVNI